MGQAYDSSTGLYYFNARWYDASIGRFISADPLPGNPFQSGSTNRYAYALDNPIAYEDVSGMAARTIATIFNAISYALLIPLANMTSQVKSGLSLLGGTSVLSNGVYVYRSVPAPIAYIGLGVSMVLTVVSALLTALGIDAKYDSGQINQTQRIEEHAINFIVAFALILITVALFTSGLGLLAVFFLTALAAFVLYSLQAYSTGLIEGKDPMTEIYNAWGLQYLGI